MKIPSFLCKTSWGSGYRIIRINQKMDPIISQAGEICGFSYEFLQANFPALLTMWVDPFEVRKIEGGNDHYFTQEG